MKIAYKEKKSLSEEPLPASNQFSPKEAHNSKLEEKKRKKLSITLPCHKKITKKFYL